MFGTAKCETCISEKLQKSELIIYCLNDLKGNFIIQIKILLI